MLMTEILTLVSNCYKLHMSLGNWLRNICN
ncbi:hypothetical protein BISU_2277 [Bifidobacterium subtile]|jgi:hypothetical protein|uniref:Uncharacterized protein n=1 Tax=Bifidobacterium subtile TaxID=77635 RepID=A0A087DU74_9BIFI|nr:hypothetical protein BISU_2277 [Bifidobacterium subtile]